MAAEMVDLGSRSLSLEKRLSMPAARWRAELTDGMEAVM